MLVKVQWMLLDSEDFVLKFLKHWEQKSTYPCISVTFLNKNPIPTPRPPTNSSTRWWLNKVESLQKRAFHFLHDNCDSSYESILKLAGKSTMNFTRLRSLSIEMFKTLNSINPTLMNGIFELRKTNKAIRNQYKHNLEVPIINQVTFGAKSLRYVGPEIWSKIYKKHIKIHRERLQMTSTI